MSWIIKHCFFDIIKDSTEYYMHKDNVKLIVTNDYFFATPDFNSVLDTLLKIQNDQIIDYWNFKVTSMDLNNGHALHTNDDNIVLLSFTLASLTIIFDHAKSGPHFIWKNIEIPDVQALKPYIERFSKLKAFL